VRAVLDPNVLIAAILSPGGAPAQLLGRWLGGDFELIVSEKLLDELERALAYPKLRARVASTDVAAFVELLARSAVVAVDPPDPGGRSADPGDDHLIALAETQQAVLVTGDAHLLALAEDLPIHTARSFVELLAAP